MIYVSSFNFPDEARQYQFRLDEKKTCFDSFYPFNILSKHFFERIDFEPITILYGGNGCGKTTALNIIAEKLTLKRDALYNRSNFFEDFVDMCSYETVDSIPEESRIITSDDVFDFMLNLRGINQGVDLRREEILQEYMDAKFDAEFKLRSLEDYDRLRQINSARRLTQSRYVRRNNPDNVPEHSNGESAFMFFTEKIRENALYLLDEPENSLSPSKQMELAKFLEDSARFFGCQLVISTHSPFLLAMHGAKIYDMDSDIVDVKHWTELANVRIWFDFFEEHRHEFDQ